MMQCYVTFLSRFLSLEVFFSLSFSFFAFFAVFTMYVHSCHFARDSSSQQANALHKDNFNFVSLTKSVMTKSDQSLYGIEVSVENISDVVKVQPVQCTTTPMLKRPLCNHTLFKLPKRLFLPHTQLSINFTVKLRHVGDHVCIEKIPHWN